MWQKNTRLRKPSAPHPVKILTRMRVFYYFKFLWINSLFCFSLKLFSVEHLPFSHKKPGPKKEPGLCLGLSRHLATT